MRSYLWQNGRAASRLLNALTGGAGDCSFSATSWELFRTGSVVGYYRVLFVDALTGDPGHCYDAWRWHEERGLILRGE